MVEENNTEAPEPIKTIEGEIAPKKRGKGRPPKADLVAVRESRKGKVGRPKGDNYRMQEFKERLLATGGQRILDKMVSIALDDGHPGQMAAIKLAIDRILPASVFDTSKAAGAAPTISINISSLGGSTTVVEDITDVEVDTYGES